MAYQFFHIETYSRKARSVKSGGYTLAHHTNSTDQVFGEAIRATLYSAHVEHPKEPLLINTPSLISLKELKKLHDQRIADISETVTAKNGTTYQRRLREDADTLYTEIHSHPMRSADYLADLEHNKPIIAAWIKLAVHDFHKRMPEGIKAAAVVHIDESHVHMHILAINADDPKLDANKLHIGKRKAAEVRETHDDRLPSLPKPALVEKPLKPKKPKPSRTLKTQAKNEAAYQKALTEYEMAVKEVQALNDATQLAWQEANRKQREQARKEAGKPKATIAYNDAMKKLQDEYYEAVGKPSGLLRDGPRKARRSTKEYEEDKQRAAALAQRKAEVEQLTKAQTAVAAQVEQLQAEKAETLEETASLRADLDNQAAHNQRTAQELMSQQEALVAGQAQVKETSKNLEIIKLELDEQAQANVTKAAELTEREGAILGKEAQLKADAEALQDQKQSLDQKLEEAERTTALLNQKEANVAHREQDISAKEAAITEREVAFRVDYSKAETKLKARLTDIEAEEERLEALNLKLIAKEQAVDAAMKEINEVTEGMEALMEAVENAEIDLVAEPQAPKRLHTAFFRLAITRPERQSPLQRLLGRFLSILKRGQNVDDGPSFAH